MYRAKSPPLPLSPGPKVWQWASPRGGGERSVECPSGVSRSTVKPGKAPQRQTYQTKQIGVTGAFQTGYKCFGRTASIFPDIGERQSRTPAWMRWYLTCHWRMGSACETREEYLEKKKNVIEGAFSAPGSSQRLFPVVGAHVLSLQPNQFLFILSTPAAMSHP